MVNYFEILNISENAEIEVIQSSYRTLAKKYHPDSTKLPNDVAAKRMALINEAYRILSDEEEKKKYIEELHRLSENSGKKEGGDKNAGSSNKDTNIDANSVKEETYSEESISEKIMIYIVWGVIVVSIVCCIIYFSPEILGTIWWNIQMGVQKIINTF